LNSLALLIKNINEQTELSIYLLYVKKKLLKVKDSIVKSFEIKLKDFMYQEFVFLSQKLDDY